MADGRQMPILAAFHTLPDGVHHSWSFELLFLPTEPGQEPRTAAIRAWITADQRSEQL